MDSISQLIFEPFRQVALHTESFIPLKTNGSLSFRSLQGSSLYTVKPLETISLTKCSLAKKTPSFPVSLEMVVEWHSFLQPSEQLTNISQY